MTPVTSGAKRWLAGKAVHAPTEPQTASSAMTLNLNPIRARLIEPRLVLAGLTRPVQWRQGKRTKPMARFVFATIIGQRTRNKDADQFLAAPPIRLSIKD
jgi:hypothetical protein